MFSLICFPYASQSAEKQARSLNCQKEYLPNISQYRPQTCSITFRVRSKKFTHSPSPHGVEVMQTKSTTVSVHRTLTERLPCITVRPFFLLLHVPPENKMIGSLKLSKLIIINTVELVEPIIILDTITRKKNRIKNKQYDHQLYTKLRPARQFKQEKNSESVQVLGLGQSLLHNE